VILGRPTSRSVDSEPESHAIELSVLTQFDGQITTVNDVFCCRKNGQHPCRNC
jgi:hypothetical protein